MHLRTVHTLCSAPTTTCYNGLSNLVMGTAVLTRGTLECPSFSKPLSTFWEWSHKPPTVDVVTSHKCKWYISTGRQTTNTTICTSVTASHWRLSQHTTRLQNCVNEKSKLLDGAQNGRFTKLQSTCNTEKGLKCQALAVQTSSVFNQYCSLLTPFRPCWMLNIYSNWCWINSNDHTLHRTVKH